MNDQTSNPIDIISKALAELAESKTVHDVAFNDVRFVEFKAKKGESNTGKGLIFTGSGTTKQFTISTKPEGFFSSESINLDRGKTLYIGNVPMLSENELGSSVIKSNLREVGRLKGLIVDGSASIGQYLFFDNVSNRLGLGTDEPKASFTILDEGAEVVVGGNPDTGHGMIGTYSSQDFEIVTDSTVRVTVKANGNIDLGNPGNNHIGVKIHGKLAIGVKVPDPLVDLHVNGAVKLNNRLHIYGDASPKDGNFSLGDIVWNENPRPGTSIGWVCTRAGNPGQWCAFGEIKASGN